MGSGCRFCQRIAKISTARNAACTATASNSAGHLLLSRAGLRELSSRIERIGLRRSRQEPDLVRAVALQEVEDAEHVLVARAAVSGDDDGLVGRARLFLADAGHQPGVLLGRRCAKRRRLDARDLQARKARSQSARRLSSHAERASQKKHTIATLGRTLAESWDEIRARHAFR